jgi:hypothetical protein
LNDFDKVESVIVQGSAPTASYVNGIPTKESRIVLPHREYTFLTAVEYVAGQPALVFSMQPIVTLKLPYVTTGAAGAGVGSTDSFLQDVAVNTRENATVRIKLNFFMFSLF